MVLRPLLLVALVITAGCGQPQAPAPDAPEPAPAAAAPEATPSPAPPPAEAPSKAPPLKEALGKVTRAESSTAEGQDPSWTHTLTDAQLADLVASLGDAAVEPGVPRCQPMATVVLYAGDDPLAELGVFCGEQGPIRVQVGELSGSLVPADHAKLTIAVSPPG